MTGFGGGDGEGDGFQIAHFPDHDHVGVFPQRAAQGAGEGFGVDVDLPLVDVASLGFDDVFDRVFQRDDVIVAVRLISSTSAARVVDLPEPTDR